MKKIANTSGRDLGVMCGKVALILETGEIAEITDEQFDQIRSSSYSFQMWRDRQFYFLDENNKRIQAPTRKTKAKQRKRKKAKAVSAGYHVRNKDGSTAEISYEQWEQIRAKKEAQRRQNENFFFWVVKQSLIDGDRTLVDISMRANRLERQWLKKIFLNEIATLEILQVLEARNEARTSDGGASWRKFKNRSKKVTANLQRAEESIAEKVRGHFHKQRFGEHIDTVANERVDELLQRSALGASVVRGAFCNGWANSPLVRIMKTNETR